MLEFQWLWVFLLLPLPYFIYRYFPKVKDIQQESIYVPFYQRLKNLQSKENKKNVQNKSFLVFMSLIWLTLILSASRPTWFGAPVNVETSGRDLMLAVDLSGSMDIKDMVWNDYSVNRLYITKKIVHDFILHRQGDRLGLILFGSEAYLQAPVTHDVKTVAKFLDESEIGMAGNNTAIGDAIGLAIKTLRKKDENSRVLILLTDGANTAGQITPLQAGQIAANEHIKIYTIGVGAEEMYERNLFGVTKFNPSKDLDEKTLSKIANITNGKYFRARNTEELKGIYQLIERLEPIKQNNETFRPQISLFHWPLLISLLLSFILSIFYFHQIFGEKLGFINKRETNINE